MSLRDALLGLKVGRRHRPFQDRPGRREGWAPHPMPLVTCDYAPFGRGWQETFDSASARPPARPDDGGAPPECLPGGPVATRPGAAHDRRLVARRSSHSSSRRRDFHDDDQDNGQQAQPNANPGQHLIGRLILKYPVNAAESLPAVPRRAPRSMFRGQSGRARCLRPCI
jgi:hypothetical protein